MDGSNQHIKSGSYEVIVAGIVVEVSFRTAFCMVIETGVYFLYFIWHFCGHLCTVLPFRSRSSKAILQLLELKFLQHSHTHHFGQQQQCVWQHHLILKSSASSRSLCVWTTQQHCEQLCFWQFCRICSISVIWLPSRKQTSNHIFQHRHGSCFISLWFRSQQYQCSNSRLYLWSHNHIKFNRYILNRCSSHFCHYVVDQGSTVSWIIYFGECVGQMHGSREKYWVFIFNNINWGSVFHSLGNTV